MSKIRDIEEFISRENLKKFKQYEKYEITKIKHEGCKPLLAKAIISDKVEDNC